MLGHATTPGGEMAPRQQESKTMEKYTYSLSGDTLGYCPDYPADTLTECRDAAIDSTDAKSCVVRQSKDNRVVAHYRRDPYGDRNRWRKVSI
jgi:hypothetical protein